MRGWNGPPSSSGRSRFSASGVEGLDAAQRQPHHLLLPPLLDGDGDAQVVVADRLDPRRPHLGVDEALEGVVGAHVVDVRRQHLVHQVTAADPRQAGEQPRLLGRHQLAQPVVGHRLVAAEAQLLQGEHRPRLDVDDDVEHAVRGLLPGVHPDLVVALLLVVVAQPFLGQQQQRLVVALVAEEGDEVALLQLLAVRPPHLDAHLRADGQREGHRHLPALRLVVDARLVDPGGAVLALDQPRLQALGVALGDAEPERFAHLGAQRLAQVGRLERTAVAVVGDARHRRPRPGVDPVDHRRPPPRFVDLRRQADAGLEVALAAEDLLHLVDAAHQAALDQRLARLLEQRRGEVAAGHLAVVALDAHRFDQQVGAQHHLGHHLPGAPRLARRRTRVEVDAGGDAARLEVAQGARDALLGQPRTGLQRQELAHLGQVLGAQGGVAVDLDGGDQRRFLPHAGGQRRLALLGSALLRPALLWPALLRPGGGGRRGGEEQGGAGDEQGGEWAAHA